MGPLIILMYISLSITSFGNPEIQLTNLIAVYLAQGQFMIVLNEKTIDQKAISIADIISQVGMLINLIQLLTIGYLS